LGALDGGLGGQLRVTLVIPLKDYNPTRRFPFVTIAIIGINVIVYAWQAMVQVQLGNEEYYLQVLLRAAAVPEELLTFTDIPPKNLIPVPLTALSAMFMHGSVMHLAGNMLYLWVFGDNIEDQLGHLQFTVFYLASGVVAAASHVIVAALGAPSSLEIPMLGASGAVAAVLGAYCILYPKVRVRSLVIFVYLIRIVDVPAAFMLGLWFFIQITSSLMGSGPGVAWWAHIGGFLIGVAWILLARAFAAKAQPH